MAEKIYGNFAAIPQISRDYYCAGGKPSQHFKNSSSLFKTRREKIAETESKFAKVYEQEMGEPLDKSLKGIVVVQYGLIPFDRDIFVNPRPQERCENQSLDVTNKIMRTPYVFEARTYWLKDGKIELLIDGREARVFELAEKAIYRVLRKLGGWQAKYEGEKMIKFSRGKHPYRVWQAENGQSVLLSLLNGAIFVVPTEQIVEEEEMPKKLYIGEVRYIREANGDIIVS